jgi:hypothetical protein
MGSNSVLAKMAVIIDAQTAQFNKSLDHSSKQFQKFSTNVASIGRSLVAGFGLIEIGRGVIDVTAEFEKFEAILTNTLGDSSKAQKALKDIREFAIATPFEVSEITAAYVRWANMGLTPTIDRMKKLGDVASSLGAGFEQTAEAFKDLAVGQTKRIEEIGISAQQANGKIQLSFKGVNLEIEKNAEGVQKALEVYSQLNGVLGTSDAVSKTLGGRISNLKDAWDNLLLTIGAGNGILGQAVESLTKIVTALANFGKEAALIGQAISPFHDLRNVSKETLDYLIKTGRTDLGNSLSKILEPFAKQDNITFLKNLDQNRQDFIYTLDKEGESIEDITVLWDHYVQKRLESAQAQREEEKAARLSEVLKLKELAIEQAKTKELQKQQSIKQNKSDGGFASRQVNLGEQAFAGIGNIDTSPLTKLAVDVTEIVQPINNALNSIPQTVIDMGPVLSAALADVATTLGEGIGNIIASGGSIRDLGPVLLGALGGVMIQLGQMAIQTGIAIGAIKKALMSLNPYVAIAAGIALVALGTAVKGRANSIGKSMGGGGGSSGGVTRSANENASRNRVDTSREMRVDFDAVFTFQQGALSAAVKSENTRNSRLNG